MSGPLTLETCLSVNEDGQLVVRHEYSSGEVHQEAIPRRLSLNIALAVIRQQHGEGAPLRAIPGGKRE